MDIIGKYHKIRRNLFPASKDDVEWRHNQLMDKLEKICNYFVENSERDVNRNMIQSECDNKLGEKFNCEEKFILHGLRIFSTTVNLSGDVFEFYHRHTICDDAIVQQIFFDQVYSFKQLKRCDELQEVYEEIVSNNKKPLIVDLGANIGASSLFFHKIFPQSTIVAVEPDDENFRLLELNTHEKNIFCRKGAIASEDGRANIIDPGLGEVGYRTISSVDGACEAISLKNLLEENIRAGLIPFIIKIDIEGAEADLFHKNTDYIDDFNVLIIELHDWMLPKENSSLPFLKFISRFSRDFINMGENIFSLKN